jgi:hypothetical protein
MSFLNASLHGNIDTTGLAEDLQSMIYLTESGCLEVAHQTDLGFVSFAGGKILAAVTKKHCGLEALREIVGWESGSFLLEKSQQPTPTHGVIDLPLTVALLLTKTQ